MLRLCIICTAVIALLALSSWNWLIGMVVFFGVLGAARALFIRAVMLARRVIMGERRW